MTITVTSPSFKEGEFIPAKYTCDGSNISPPISWEPVPGGTKGFALISDDPDCPGKTWVHWVIYNIPAGVHSLPEGISASEYIPDGTLQGKNDWGKAGYGGPCPPSGIHRYLFKVYALDEPLDTGPGVTKSQLLDAMQGHIIAAGQLMGKYKRG